MGFANNNFKNIAVELFWFKNIHILVLKVPNSIYK